LSEPVLLASDAERDRTVELLRRETVDGRLTLEEFAQRMGSAYEARTREQLDELTRDLPAEPATVPARRRASAKWIVAVMGGATAEAASGLVRERTSSPSWEEPTSTFDRPSSKVRT